MNDTYIKHPNGGYCYFHYEKKELSFLSLVDYFIKKGVITDEKIRSDFLKMKVLCKNSEFNYVYYSVYSQKSIHNKNRDYPFDLIEKNYQKILKTHELAKSLIQVLMGLKKEIKAITNLEFEEYLPTKKRVFDEKEYYFDNKFEREAKKIKGLGYYAVREYVKDKTRSALEQFKNDYDGLSVITCHKEFYSSLKLNLEDLVLYWEEVLDEHGKPIQIEHNSALDHFQHSTSYAIFYEKYNTTGYWYQKDYGLMSIREAKLFATQAAALDQMKKYNLNGVVVEIDVNFMKIVNHVGSSIDLRHLDTVIAHQEKTQLENRDTAQSLAAKLLDFVQDNDTLVKQLKEIIEPTYQSTPIHQKKSRKI